MQWNSFGEFLTMGGYGLYIWPSFGMTALCMAWEVAALRLRRTAALRSLSRPAADEEKAS